MSSRTIPKTILLKGEPSYHEGIANAAITPGHLIEVMSTGKLRVAATAAATVAALFAREEEYIGYGIDNAYAADDQVPYMACQSGDEVYAWLENAANVAVGALLESAGDGSLQATTKATTNATTAAAYPIAIALQAVDNSAGGTGPNSAARIKVRIL